MWLIFSWWGFGDLREAEMKYPDVNVDWNGWEGIVIFVLCDLLLVPMYAIMLTLIWIHPNHHHELLTRKRAGIISLAYIKSQSMSVNMLLALMQAVYPQ